MNQKTIIRHLELLDLLIFAILLGVRQPRIRLRFMIRGLWLIWVISAHFSLHFVQLLHARSKILPRQTSIHTKFLLSSRPFRWAGILFNLTLLIFIILLFLVLFHLDVGIHKRFISLAIYLLGRIWHHLTHRFLHFLKDFFTGFELLLVKLFNRLVKLLFVVLTLWGCLIRIGKVGQ